MNRLAKNSSQRLRTWLGMAETQEYLERFIARKVRQLRSQSPVLLEVRYGASADHQEIGQEVTQDFLVFFLDDFSFQIGRNPELCNLMLSNRLTLLVDFAWQRFLWQWQEQGRKRDTNPRGYLYRRLRECLQQDARFQIKVRRRPAGTLFRLADSTPTDPNPAILEDDFSSWPRAEQASGRAMHQQLTASYLTGLAHWFWQEASKRLDKVSWLRLSDLCRYLAHLHPWLNRPLPQQEETLEQMAGSAKTIPEELHVVRFQKQSVEILGMQFSAGLSRKACTILLLRLQEPPCPYGQIAERLGLKSYQQAYRIQKKTEEQLRAFCSNWPGPPVEELAPEVEEQFVESIRAGCKNKLSCP